MIIDGDNVLYDELKALTNADTPYTTAGEEIYTVDTSSGVLTVELATADTSAGFHKRLFDVGGSIETNAVTFTTEGSENVDGGASVTWDHNNGSYVDLWSDGTNWYTSLQAAFDALAADSITDGSANTITDFAGTNLSVSSGTLNVSGAFPVTTVSTATTTTGSGIYLVDTSSAGVTLTLASADATGNASILVVNVDGSNAVTVDTESTETIDPGAESSKTISNAGEARWYSSDGTNWDESSVAEFDEINNQNYVEPQATETTPGASYNIDLSVSNYHKITLNDNTTFDFINADATDANSLTLHLVQDGTGGRTPSFTPTVVWDNGTAPSWSTGANDEDVVSFVHDQDGSQWLGFLGGLNFG